jgi:hypothetical protein
LVLKEYTLFSRRGLKSGSLAADGESFNKNKSLGLDQVWISGCLLFVLEFCSSVVDNGDFSSVDSFGGSTTSGDNGSF